MDFGFILDTDAINVEDMQSETHLENDLNGDPPDSSLMDLGQPGFLNPPVAQNATIFKCPQEIFDEIASYLEPADKFAMVLTSNALYAAMKLSLHTKVKLKGKTAVGQFVKAIATRPKIRDRVKTCWLEGDVCCGGQEMLDFISALKRLGSLQELGFQPVDTMEICGKIMLPSLQSILAGHVVGSLRALHIDLKNRDASGLHPVAQRDLLQRLFSIKSLKAITALYRARNDRQEDDVIRDPLPLMKTTKITDLQTLALQWDGLSLEWITALLQLPRSLKEFTLLFSPRWHSLLHTPPRPSMYLDDVLEPVLDSLQTFHLHAVGRGGPSTGWFDVKWSKRGLGAFRNLQELSISCQFLLSLHIDLESRRWFPLSLVKLQLTQLLLQLTEIYNCLTLDPTSVPLKLLSRQLDMLTRLRSVTVITENMKMEDLKKPPRVLLERSYQDLVNRAELKIFADVENGKHPLEFEVRD